MTPESDVRAIATRWLAMDQDPVTRAALQELLDADDDAPLLPLFSGRLPFGTAGLRAEVGPGPMRMNTLVIAQTAAGINQYPFVDAQAGGVLAGAYAAAAAKDLDLQTFFLIRQTVYRQCYQAVLRANRAAISTSSRCSGVRKRIA